MRQMLVLNRLFSLCTYFYALIAKDHFGLLCFRSSDSSGLDNDNAESGIGTATPPKEQVSKYRAASVASE